jgi:ubiquinone/menaquinone biosynthesis C-methylase UbiE
LLAREERHILENLPAIRDCRVLDLACGTGRWLNRLSTAGARYAAGVDSSNAMLKVAMQKKDLASTLVQADCGALPFSSSSFDFAICSFALGHMKDLRRAALEFRHVLHPGSSLFVSILHPEAYALGWRTGFRDKLTPVEVETIPHAAEDLLRAFHAAGLACVTHDALCLGAPERLLFAQTGRDHLFEAAARVPAILFCHFKSVSRTTHFEELV